MNPFRSILIILSILMLCTLLFQYRPEPEYRPTLIAEFEGMAVYEDSMGGYQVLK